MDTKLIKAFVFNRTVLALLIGACFVVTALDLYLENSQANIVNEASLQIAKNIARVLSQLDSQGLSISEVLTLNDKLIEKNAPLRLKKITDQAIKDSFQKRAFKALMKNPNNPYYIFEDKPHLELRYVFRTSWGFLEIDLYLDELEEVANKESLATFWVLILLALTTLFSTTLFFGYWTRLKEILLETQQKALEYQKQLTDSYERFFPRQFFYLLHKNSVLDIHLGDQSEREMAILFSDIRNFTTITEHKTPAECFRLINDYLQFVGPVIRKNNGFIDKYFGDAILALFDRPDDALISTLSIIAFLQKKASEGETSYDNITEIRTGIHFGWVMVGTVGEELRMDGTVISDNVNTASRLEQLNKVYGTRIIASEKFVNRLENKQDFKIRFIDHVYVVGKQEPIRIYEIYDMDNIDTLVKKQQIQRNFDKGLEYYENRNFAMALSYFMKCYEVFPEDPVTNIFILRVKGLIAEPPDENWSPVIKLTHKDSF